MFTAIRNTALTLGLASGAAACADSPETETYLGIPEDGVTAEVVVDPNAHYDEPQHYATVTVLPDLVEIEFTDGTSQQLSDDEFYKRDLDYIDYDNGEGPNVEFWVNRFYSGPIDNYLQAESFDFQYISAYEVPTVQPQGLMINDGKNPGEKSADLEIDVVYEADITNPEGKNCGLYGVIATYVLDISQNDDGSKEIQEVVPLNFVPVLIPDFAEPDC